MMNILVTGSNGFVGKNLVSTLNQLGHTILTYDQDNTLTELDLFTKSCDFVVHLAGINRTTDSKEFYDGNSNLTNHICTLLRKNNNKSPILVSSSIQAELVNDYGKSKKEGERYLIEHSEKNDSKVYIYRFSNLFGKWSKPNYNSVIATWCYNVSRNIPIQINDENIILNLEYIDDVVNEVVRAIHGKPNIINYPFCEVKEKYSINLGDLAKLILSFKEQRKNFELPNLDNKFEKHLYSTFLSYMETSDFSYPLKMNVDDRGSFTEFIKTNSKGQISINISKPGITKGQHWHHSKHEKFLVVSGSGTIKLRDIFSEEIIEYNVSGDTLEVVDIPPGYTHNIINTGKNDMVTVMWVNEIFNPLDADTYYLEV